MTAPDDFVSRVIREVEGYPYSIQLWGAEMGGATRDAGMGRLAEQGVVFRNQKGIYVYTAPGHLARRAQRLHL